MDDDDELEEIQRKKIQERLRAAYIEEKKRELLNKYLEPEAYDRITNVKHANPELYDKVVEIILQLAATGRLTRRITDKELLGLLSKLTERREPTIEIRRK